MLVKQDLKLLDKIKTMEVEYFPLNELVLINKGEQLNKTNLSPIKKDEYIYPVMNGGVKPTGWWKKANQDKNKIIVCQGGNAGYVHWLGKTFYAGAHAYVLNIKKENLILNKFLYFFLKQQQNNLINLSTGTTIKGLAKKDLENFIIPIPPLEIQQQIVEVLDQMTELESELESELELRIKEYEYYQNLFLDFDNKENPFFENDLKEEKISEYVSIVRGGSPRPIKKYIAEEINENTIPWIKINDTDDGKYINETKQHIVNTKDTIRQTRLVKKGDILLSNSMSYGRPYIVNMDKGAIHDGWALLHINDENSLNKDFLYYVLKSNKTMTYWDNKVQKGTVSNLNGDIMRSLMIKVPSIQTQLKIVDILDRFSQMTTDLKVGLPALIELENKRYNYYLNALMDFKPLNIE